MIRLYDSPSDRILQANLWRAARRWVAEREGHDEEFRLLAQRRETAALIGAGVVYSGQESRDWIRDVARRAARQALVHGQRLTLGHWEGFEVAGREHLDGALAAGRSAIVAPLHAGRFHFISPSLLQQGLRLACLLDQSNFDGLGRELSRLKRPDVAYSQFTDPFDHGIATVSSASPSALWALRRALGDGRVVVLFPDGNSGMADARTDRQCLRVPFFGRVIAVRAGAAALAAHASCPIVPASVHERPRRPPLLELEPPIWRAPGEDAAQFRQRAMELLFAHVESHVRRAPARWEEWPHLHRWLLDAPPPTDGRRPPADLDLGAAIRAGAQLRLANPHVWVLSPRGIPEVFDLSTGVSLSRDEERIRLVEAAEQGRALVEYLFVNGPAAPRAVRELLAAGAIELVPASDQSPRSPGALRSPSASG